MTRQNLVIGVGAVATAGKDTFFKLLNKKFPNARRFALADNLKHELNLFFISQYNIDIFNCTPEEKEAVRPILVAHGKIRRKASNGTHWTGKLKTEIEEWHKNNPDGIAVVTDVRYDEYEKDEAYWLQEEMNGFLVHIKRYKFVMEETSWMEYGKHYGVTDNVKEFIEPPNDDERKNDPKIQQKADYRIEWPTAKDVNELEIYINEFADWLNK